MQTLEPRLRLLGAEAEHLRVLRPQVGDQVVLCDGAGREADGVIVSIELAAITLELGPSRLRSLELPQPVTVFLPLLKGDKLADVVRACTELGVGMIQLFWGEHADVREIGQGKLERLRRIVLEAAKQSGRTVTPQVHPPVRLEELSAVPWGLVAHPQAAARVEEPRWDVPVSLITGPEGGFSAREVEVLEGRGFVACGLGPRILRAETAPIVLLAAVTAARGL